MNLYFTYGVKAGRIDFHQFVNTASTQTAKLFGLFPSNGIIQPGADADLVVCDPNFGGKISAKTRGKIAARGGKFIGEKTRGQLLKREPNHF